MEDPAGGGHGLMGGQDVWGHRNPSRKKEILFSSPCEWAIPNDPRDVHVTQAWPTCSLS